MPLHFAVINRTPAPNSKLKCRSKHSARFISRRAESGYGKAVQSSVFIRKRRAGSHNAHATRCELRTLQFAHTRAPCTLRTHYQTILNCLVACEHRRGKWMKAKSGAWYGMHGMGTPQRRS
ncbi:hypothetical protein GOP47_0019195 [Adiantum capillus-veneris]|uniref:Uncharacterized protein n=1 Tax=Adiantum capillus-veneris TaxID=13818 RepID=A0A9D4UFZ5_ADICA|nr:hypothetical protein GOP47_0019195 [Adiantum capillus-veneris]